MRTSVATAVSLLLATGFNLSATAFTADGYKSGMSRAEVTTIASGRSLEIWDVAEGVIALGIRSDFRIDGTITFCESRLYAYNRNIDFDADYVQTLQRFLSEYGQPARVFTGEQPWSGPGSGYVRSAQMSWWKGDDRVSLTVVPEGRDGKGMLRHNRNANVSFLARSKCSFDQFSKP